MALTDEQRAARRLGLGGSDAAAALGLNPWKTPYQLYLEKIEGGVDTPSEAEAAQWGQLLEPIVAQQFAARTGKVLYPGMETERHKTFSFLLAHPDYYVIDENAGLEVKTASEWMADRWGEGEDHVPEYYLTQGLHYCAVCNWERCYFAVLIGGNKLRTYTVEADAEAMKMIIAAEVRFWTEHVTLKEPPPLTSDELSKRWTKTTGVQIGVTGDVFDAVVKLKTLRRQIKVLEEQDSELAATIKQAIADSDVATFDGKRIASWLFNRSSQRFDIEKFKTEQPDLYAQYLREMPGARVLRLA